METGRATIGKGKDRGRQGDGPARLGVPAVVPAAVRAVVPVYLLPLLLLIILAVPATPASGQPLGAPGEPSARDLFEASLEEQIRTLDTEALERFVAGLDEDIRRAMPTFDLRSLLRGEEGTWSFDGRKLLTELARYMGREVVFQSRLLGQLVVLAVLCALLQNVGRAFGGPGAAEVAYLVAFLVIMFLALRSFQSALDIGRQTVSAMTSFMFALLPLLSTLLAAAGALSSAAVFHPLLITVVTMVAGLIEGVVFPLLFFTAVLAVASNMVEGFPFSRLAHLARHAGIVVLGLSLTVFLGIMVVRGALAPIADGVALRAAKFLTGTFIPIVGRMMADAVEVVAGGAVLIKGAVGAFGLLAIIVLAAFPLAKILSIVLIYRVVTALVQPISDGRLVSALEGLADTLTLLMVAVGSVAVMFFIGVTVVIGVGHATMMLR